MAIPADEAASALKDAEAAAGRTQAAIGYRFSSLFLLLWGLIWFVDNVVCQVSLPTGQIVTSVSALIGVFASVALGARQGGRKTKGGGVKALVIALAIGGFGIGASIIAPPVNFAQSEAIAALAVGAVYMAMGASGGWGLRLSAVGAAMLVATVVGWVYARDLFFAWMAVFGGGGLILGGLWMRNV